MVTFLPGVWGPGEKKVRLWPEMRTLLGDLWERNRHLWSPGCMLTHLSDHFNWATAKVLEDPDVGPAWDAMVAEVYKKAGSAVPLPAPRVVRGAMDAYITAWLTFMGKNELQRMGITTKKYGATGFMAGLNQKKKVGEEDRDLSGTGKRLRPTRGGGVADEGARGNVALTFVLTRSVAQWFGVKLVWLDRNGGQVEVSDVNADRAQVVGWRCTTAKFQDKCLQRGDVVVSVNGTVVDSSDQGSATAFMDRAVQHLPVKLEVMRNTNKRYAASHGIDIASDIWRIDSKEGAHRTSAANKIVWLGVGDDDVGLGPQGDASGANDDQEEVPTSPGPGSGGREDGDGARRDGSRKRARASAPSRPPPPRTRGGPPRGYILYGDITITVVGRYYLKQEGSTRLIQPGTVLELKHAPVTGYPNAVEVHGPRGRVGFLPESSHQVLVKQLLTQPEFGKVHCRAVVRGRDVRHDSLDITIEVRVMCVLYAASSM